MPVIDKAELGKRLALLPEILKTNNRRIALSIGADPSYYGRALNGNGISMPFVEKLIAEYKIARNWILFGEGEPLPGKKYFSKESEPNQTPKADVDEISRLPISDKEKIFLYQERIAALEKENNYWRKFAETVKTITTNKGSRS
jgi:hypothetical protein